MARHVCVYSARSAKVAHREANNRMNCKMRRLFAETLNRQLNSCSDFNLIYVFFQLYLKKRCSMVTHLCIQLTHVGNTMQFL